jgi:hypothetical protein
MKLAHVYIVSCCLLISSVGLASAKEWRGIVPLKSKRADVERLLGPVPNGFPHYVLPDETVYVEYAYPCGYKNPPGWPDPPPGWNVPKDTVVSISVEPKESILFSSLALDLSKFEKVEGDSQHFNYIDGEEGFTVNVFGSCCGMGEKVSAYIYHPTAKEEKAVRCKEDR